MADKEFWYTNTEQYEATAETLPVFCTKYKTLC